MFDLQVCRGCLAVNGKMHKLGPTYERIFNNLTGLMLNKRDGYPKYFCWECKLQIKKSLMFARRVKRAHFVLKEIMTVRDQIALDDVIKVDRTKTNLDSSIGYWKTDKIERNALYQIEGTDEPVDTSEDSTRPNDCMQPQKYDRNEFLTCTIVDIEPVIEIDEDVQQPAEQSSVGNQDVTDDVTEDVANDSLVGTEQDKYTIPEDIDMEDVFKGLEPEKEESDDDHLEDLFPPKHKKKKSLLSSQRTHRIPRSNIAYATLGKEKAVWMFLNVDMAVLDHAEQLHRFWLRLQEPKFAKAMYKCGLCVTLYDDLQSLMDHVKHHNAQKDYKFECEVCRDRFNVKDYLDMHVMDSHLYQYTCRLCDDDVVCYSLVDLMAHFKKHEMPSLQHLDPGERETLLASFRVQLMRPEEVHLSAAPGERHVYHRKGKCAVCLLELAPDVINEHMVTRHAVTEFRAFQCEHCKVYFLKLGSLRRHLRECHTFRYTCRKCREVFYSMSLAKIHAKKCEAPCIDDIFLCSDCGKMCKNRTGLFAHRRIVHQVSSQEHCVICGRPYINEEALIRHQLESHHYVSLNHPLVGDTRYQCKRCAVIFLFEQAYHTHLFTMGHDEAKELDGSVGCFSCRVYFKNPQQRAAHQCGTTAVNSCPHCDVVLNKAAALREHVLSAHPGVPCDTFVIGRRLCDVCGKHVQPSMFKSHMTAHTELAATLACPRCPLVAQNVAQLAEHVLGAHADRPFVCATCGERFQKKYILSNHLRKIHIKLLCELCNRRFKRPTLLETHMRVIHQIEYKLNLTTLKKTSSKLVIYRDMKVDVSLLNDSVIDQLKLEVIDFIEKSPIEVTDKWQYLFKEENPKSFLVAPTDGKKKKSKKRKKKESSLKAEVGDDKIEATDRVEHIEQAEINSEHNGDSELFGDETNTAATNGEVNSGDNVESEMYEVDDMDMAMSEEVIVQDGNQLIVDEENIMEVDGERMININGVLYKFEDEV